MQRRTDAFYNEGKRLYYRDLVVDVRDLKKKPETAWLSEVSSVVLQQSLRHLDNAFTRFFLKNAGYPTFKSRKDAQSCSYMNNAFTFRAGKLTLAKHSKPLDIHWSRKPPQGVMPSSVTVTRTTGGRYFVSLLFEEDVSPLPTVAHEVGIDLNTAEVVCSDGKRYATPKQIKKLEVRKRHYQRSCRRKIAAAKVKLGLKPNAVLPKGAHLPISKNLAKAFLKTGRVVERIGNVRRDWQHKMTTAIIRENQVVAVEDLHVGGMTASARGTAEAPGSRVAQKSGLNRAILGVGFGEICRQLEYKSAWYGRTFVKIDRWYPSSKRCSAPGCGYIFKKLLLSQRKWTCPRCGTVHDRDENAAKNILSAGKAILAGADALRMHEPGDSRS